MKPKYRLTKLEKLQMHRLMWLWLAEYDERSKEDWWIIYEDYLQDCIEDCFLCEIFSLECGKCPLAHHGGNCHYHGTWFRLWSPTHQPIYARRIAHCADRLIAELEAKQ